MRAHVRYTSKRSNKIPKRTMDRYSQVSYPHTYSVHVWKTEKRVQTYIKPILARLQPIKQQMAIHLCLDEHEINKEDDKVVLDVFVREFLAVRTLR